MRISILGNGPSLSKLDLTTLEPGAFVCNRIHLHPSWQEGWRPHAYVMTDKSQNDQWKTDLRYHLDQSKFGIYKTYIAYDLLLEAKDVIGFWADHPGVTPIPECHHIHVGFNPPLEWHFPSICTFGGPVYVATQIAVQEYAGVMQGMDFYGCDGNYRAGEQNNFAQDYLPAKAHQSRSKNDLRNRTLQIAYNLIHRELRDRRITSRWVLG